MLYRIIKRAFDIVSSCLALVAFSPVFLVAAIGILVSDPGPVIYLANRVGKDNEIFRMYKFRSMRVDRNANEKSLRPDQDRIFPFGRFIRRTKIDELPQLLNVIFNDMSLVGPRPAKPDEVRDYTPDQRKCLNIKPGITGSWQVSGRSDTTFAEKVHLDKDYIQSWSIKNDLVILLKTIPAVLTGKGAY